ncbi:MAG: bifunctional anthranilate synthase component I family protein/class IV aminotransferase [Magnetococcales bacterium]|nr:bifunctional anthranilate synthase component I family protein/class IV aminotransferase [Magnetococcales bacterium]
MSPTTITATQLHAGTCLLFDFAGLDAPLYFHHPLRIYQTGQRSEVAALLRQVEQEALAGYWVGGFIAYEAAGAFALPVQEHAELPLIWFAVFAQAEAVTFPHLPNPSLPAMQPEMTWERYQQDIDTILSHIRAGDSYQVNYTVSARLSAVEPANLFLALQSAHRHPYGAWLHCDAVTVASFSPELFLQRQGNRLLTAPIKGTTPRLPGLAADAALGQALLRSPKERAEHVMIVDMARNDLGKVCRIGTVQVESLFERRLFATVQHLESRVSGQQLPGIGWDQLLAALFPAASITGAPKHRTMAIIQALERRARGIYTGSLVLFRPGGDFISSVAIRTVSWQREPEGRIGLGGGIVADSESGREWQEIADKGQFLRTLPEPLLLIETLLMDQSGVVVQLEQHLDRLQRSARCLGFACDRALMAATIRQQAATWFAEAQAALIVRLLLDCGGGFELQKRSCPLFPARLRVRVAPYGVDRLDPLLRHKSSRRQLFDQALAQVRAVGDDEALFFNAFGHVTEGSIRAIAVLLAGQWYVPPLEDGLLESLWRAEVRQRLGAQEKSLTLADLLRAEAVYMGNSVQGGVPVVRLNDAEGRLLAEWKGETGLFF